MDHSGGLLEWRPVSEGPGQVDWLWILDVDGERFVIDAMHMPSADAKDREELWQVTESIHFEP